MKMLLLNVTIICCLFTCNLKNTASNALTIHLNNRKRVSTEISYEKRNNKKNINIQFTRNPAYRQSIRQATSNTNRRPLNISFEPLGHLKLDGITHGKVNIDLEAIKNAVTSLTTGAVSQLQNLSQYLPSLNYFQNDNEKPSDENNSDPESSEGHHSNNDDSAEENESDTNDSQIGDDSEKDESVREREDSDQEKNNESDHQDEDDDHSKEEDDEDNNDKSEHSDEQKNRDNSETPKNSQADKSSKEKKSSEEKQPEPGYLETFQKYYSYAKPLAKAASMFVPGLGQYRQVMFGLEMVDLAYQTSLMYTEGEGMLSIGWFLGKEAFSRLGRRGEIEPHNIPLPIDTSTEASSAEMELFLDKVKSRQYPQLEDEKENRIRQLVSETIDKYFHEHENLKNETQRIRFIDLMTLCIKFIALEMANDGGESS